ncbi:DnaA regulatory inactivator Hda [Noviherbaspirillum pedocola]|uniref:DnaA regulatory inactivator Hda n=1 Tax=Noviherbaspirillum pedocola TaxID=2801341 RepID=A0A934W173_9BURK|nr:DnaA regulatory inactivator Hda [Noviherbaspirillum pedocola]MBK4734876.1 DnaA regulatory inactivator Hda [Noviherbaspirillum pedocola]
MRQLLLDLNAEKWQTLANFEAGRNAELYQLMRRLASHSTVAPHERFVYLWGRAGAGKTHLLRALAASSRSRYLAADAPQRAWRFEPDIPLYLLDDCEQLPAKSQIAAFNLFNEAREHGAMMIVAGAVPPAVLPVREDLRTRMSWGLIYQVHELSDEEKIAALNQAAQARGLQLSAGVLPYLITHFQRDMRSLSAMLDALDRYSLETQRPITLPLLRSLLQLEEESKT